MRSTGVAYLLWLFGGCGALGLHRFYLGKYPTGVLWLCTGGLCWMGALYDFFTLGRPVRETNILLAYEGRADAGRFAPIPAPAARKDSLERCILRTAKANAGVVTAADVALEADVSIAEAQKTLEKLSTSGFAEMKIRTNGAIVYFFKEFSPNGRNEFVDI